MPSPTPKKITNAQIPLVRAALLKRQDYICAICSQPTTVSTGCLDHCHTTGRIRGVLCRNCNGLEGKVKSLANRGRRNLEPYIWLNNMAKYWLHHKTDRVGVLHPTYRTIEEKRVLVNKRARVKRAKVKLIAKKG